MIICTTCRDTIFSGVRHLKMIIVTVETFRSWPTFKKVPNSLVGCTHQDLADISEPALQVQHTDDKRDDHKSHVHELETNKATVLFISLQIVLVKDNTANYNFQIFTPSHSKSVKTFHIITDYSCIPSERMHEANSSLDNFSSVISLYLSVLDCSS